MATFSILAPNETEHPVMGKHPGYGLAGVDGKVIGLWIVGGQFHLLPVTICDLKVSARDCLFHRGLTSL